MYPAFSNRCFRSLPFPQSHEFASVIYYSTDTTGCKSTACNNSNSRMFIKIIENTSRILQWIPLLAYFRSFFYCIFVSSSYIRHFPSPFWPLALANVDLPARRC
nr:MAG TPA: hypothetical protein [Caudoviricetes sp.]